MVVVVIGGHCIRLAWHDFVPRQPARTVGVEKRLALQRLPQSFCATPAECFGMFLLVYPLIVSKVMGDSTCPQVCTKRSIRSMLAVSCSFRLVYSWRLKHTDTCRQRLLFSWVLFSVVPSARSAKVFPKRRTIFFHCAAAASTDQSGSSTVDIRESTRIVCDI